ncbi:hypothetical protein [Lewinella sp. W8]|nr:hypothetical protein [Lewinella sp. W8]
MKNNEQTTQPNDRQHVLICTCCLTFFPLVYLIGSSLRHLLA